MNIRVVLIFGAKAKYKSDVRLTGIKKKGGNLRKKGALCGRRGIGKGVETHKASNTLV